MSEQTVELTHEQIISIFKLGMNEALWRHAWWKDGEQIVGNMGQTLKSIRAKLKDEEIDPQIVLDCMYEGVSRD